MRDNNLFKVMEKNVELYLLGVMDATEGKSWCNYQTYKTITLRERIYEAFKKPRKYQFNNRAATVIENISFMDGH